MEFRVAKAARITGGMLERLVREQLKGEPDAVVCYGFGYNGPKPALNSACSSLSKMQQGVRLREALGDGALLIVPAATMVPAHLPAVARKVKHAKGTDMRVCRTVAQVRRAVELGREFFTPLVESDTEYRAWVYRKRTLCVYEKRLTEPDKNLRFGRNRANGWTFHALTTEQIPEAVRQVAVKAVAALNLDFGAVDILGKWNQAHTEVTPTVLEVNSAPGVSDEHRSAIVKLVHRIVRWAETGCPPR